jgi:glycerol-3-phosphate dehydrogenase subunit B
MNDIVVIGGGLGGYMAALSAARERPHGQITLLTRDDEFAHHPGTIDVLGYVGDQRYPVVTPERRMNELADEHPYIRVGEQRSTEAFSLFDDVTDDHYKGTLEKNVLLMSPTGRVTPTSRYPAGMAAGLVSDSRETLVVGIQGLSEFDAYYLADTFDTQLPYTVNGESISLNVELSENPALSIARALDGDASQSDAARATAATDDANQPDTRTSDEQTFETPLDELIERVREKLDIEQRLGLPAVLGLTDHRRIRETIQERLAVDVFEIPIGHPHIGGLRLERLLDARLRSHGVTVESVTVEGYEQRGDSIQRIECDQDGTAATYSGHGYILATGGLETGGLVSDRTGVREPIFDCHVSHPSDRAEWSAADLLDDQPFAEFGVTVDDQLRPQTERGTPEFSNLRAVGPLLGGTNFTAQKSRSGVAVITGYTAGMAAIPDE